MKKKTDCHQADEDENETRIRRGLEDLIARLKASDWRVSVFHSLFITAVLSAIVLDYFSACSV